MINLKKLREEFNLNQTQLAEQSGVSQSLVSKLETGNIDVNLEPLVKILEIYGYSVAIVDQKGITIPVTESSLKEFKIRMKAEFKEKVKASKAKKKRK